MTYRGIVGGIAGLALAGLAGSAGLAGASGAAGAAPGLAGRGAWEYREACAVCHGADGRGDGSLAPVLRVAPPDLTRLAARNAGVFPYDRVFGVIDGRYLVDGHGSGEMPVWGRLFTEEAARGAMFWGGDPALEVAGRIHVLVLYLKAIQGGATVTPRPPERHRRAWPEDIPRPDRR